MGASGGASAIGGESVPAPGGLEGVTTLVATARSLGDRIGSRGAGSVGRLEPSPLRIAVEAGGRSFVFRFGVLVTVGLEPEHERRVIEAIAPQVVDPHERVATESATILVDPLARDGVGEAGEVVVAAATPERLEVIAEVLAKSAVLGHYEERVAEVFERVESLARQLREARLPRNRRALFREIGEVLRIRARMVGRVEVTEKPDLLWEAPELDRFYERLAREYELAERDRALARKLEVVASVSETFLELLNHRQTLRVEWYIVVLILVEIALGLYQMIRSG